MASTWSDLKFELIGTGDQSGTWGGTTNDNIGIAIQQAIGGKADVTMSSTSITLSLTDTTALQDARALYLNLTGTPGGAATLNVPAVQKAYIVYNNTTGGFAVTVKVTGQTGVSVPNGKTMVLYDNGTDVVDAITHLSSLTLGSALPVGSGGTGITSLGTGVATALGNNVNTTGGLVTQSGTLAASALLLGGGSGTAISSTTTGTNVVTALGNNANSANGIGVLNASGLLAVAQGGTNATSTPTAGAVAYGTGSAYAFNTAGSSGQPLLSAGSSAPTFGTLGVAGGGTGATTLTANNVILGNGTSAVQFVAPGSSGNVLTSNGTTWTSTAGTSFATPLTVVGNATAGSEIRLPEDTDNGSNYVALKAADNLASNLTFTLPSVDGTNGQVLQTNGSGTLSFTSQTSLATPLAVVGNSSAGAEIRLPEDTDNGSNYVALKAADNLASNLTLTLPSVDGTNGQFLQTNGSGVLSFASAVSGALTNNTRQAVTSSASTTIDLANGNVIDLTMAANITTLSFTNVPASGTPILIQIVVINASTGTSYSIVWPNTVYWSAAGSGSVQVAPTLATGANGVTVIALLTTDGGTKYRGWVEASIPGSLGNQLFTWGSNTSGLLGQNTDGTGGANKRSSPVQVGALTNWASASPSLTSNACIAIKTDGTLWTWGYNNHGQIGDNTTIARSSPVQVGALTTWVSAAINTHAIALKSDGTLWAWGRGHVGQCGQNNVTYFSSPVQVGALTTWASVSAGNETSFAIKTDGTLWAWGRNNTYGQLGINSLISMSSPVQVGALTTWSSVSGGQNIAIARQTGGTIYAWGTNASGQIGDNTRITRSSPVQIGALTTWASVSSGEAMQGAIKTDGTLWMWGQGTDGRLGTNDAVSRSSPVQIGALTNWSSISVGLETCVAKKTDGTLWAWGTNQSGQVGQNDVVSRSSPVQVGALNNWNIARTGSLMIAAVTSAAVNPA